MDLKFLLEQDKKYYRNIRYIPKSITQDLVNIYMYDNKVAITSTLKECYGLVIESKELSNMLKTLWQVIWAVSEER